MDGDPPCLTAMIIFFPKVALHFAFFISVFPLVCARTAAALPINNGHVVLVPIVENPEEGENAVAEHINAANDSKVIGLIILEF